MLPFTLPALPVSVSGRPDSARGAPGERGTPREVQRLPLGEIRREETMSPVASPHELGSSVVSSSEAGWTSRTSPGGSARSALGSGLPRTSMKTGGYTVQAPTAQLMDVQRHLEVIRFTVLREHAKMRERAKQAKEQLAVLQRVYDEMILSFNTMSFKEEHCMQRLAAFPQLLWTMKLTSSQENLGTRFELEVMVEKTEAVSLHLMLSLVLRGRKADEDHFQELGCESWTMLHFNEDVSHGSAVWKALLPSESARKIVALRGHLEVSTVAPPDPFVTDVTSGGHWSAPQIVNKNRHGLHRPNIYLELMPLRLHCQLTLAQLRLDLGAIDEACKLLQDAELCMTRCVQKVPWQHVQFSLLKLRWRRLKYRIGLAPSAPLDAPNAILYRDPKTFATGICPPTDSPLYRTFLQKAKPPHMVSISEWVPPYERQPEEALQLYMQEFLEVARLALKEGGNDLRQLLQLFDEGLEELLRTEVMLLKDSVERTPDFQKIYPFFACFAAAARNRKALLFEPPQGAGPAPVDAEKLPLRVALNLQRQLQRQATEGALAYSGTALETAKKQIMYRSMMRPNTS
eukprot:symbB.v1.2.027504.t3/scaffold2829.1/size69361/2